MQQIAVDEVGQADWLEAVRKAHGQVKLSVVDAAEGEHLLIDIAESQIKFASFEGEALTLKLELSKRETRWRLELCPVQMLRIQVDARGQLEVWSHDVPVAKWFDEDATAEEWPNSLLYVTAGRVRNLSAVLGSSSANTVYSLSLGGATELVDLAFLPGFEGLRSLNLTRCGQITSLGPLAALKQLISLDLSDCGKLADLIPLAGLKQLTTLDLSLCDRLTDLGPLAGLEQLKSLDLSCCEQLTELGPLAGLEQLKSLHLIGCEQLTELGPLAGLKQLTTLDLAGCNRLTDLGPLAGLKQLTTLDFSRCSRLTDLGPLAGVGAGVNPPLFAGEVAVL